VIMQAAPDAEQHGRDRQAYAWDEPLGVKVDLDVMKLAILNVVLNGAS